MRRQCCLPMTENPEASVLTAKRAPQHIRLSRANDAYEHLCILTLLPSLAPLHLMLADTPWPHGFGATYESSSRTPLLGPSPLRTVHASFPAHSSSPSNASLGETRFRDGNMLAMNLVVALRMK